MKAAMRMALAVIVFNRKGIDGKRQNGERMNPFRFRSAKV